MTDKQQLLGAITLFVSDRDASRTFYARLFADDPMFEDESSAAFQLTNVIVNLLARAHATELVTPVSVGGANAGATQMLTLDVDDVDAAAGELTAMGIELLNGPMDRPWGVRTAAFADPDGHVWELAAKIER